MTPFRAEDNRTQKALAAMRRPITRAEAIGLLILIIVVFLIGNSKAARVANNVAAFSKRAVQQNVDARYDDCQNINHLVLGFRLQIQQSYKTLPLLYKLVPSLHTPQVEALEQERYEQELKEFSPLNCVKYALAAVPPKQRGNYHAP